MSDQTEHLGVCMLRLQKQGLIVPADTIAEVIDYEPLQRVEDSPDWLLGLLGWRGVQVPVIAFEVLTLARASFSLVSVSSAVLVILRGVSDQNALPYYALVSQVYPEFSEASREMLFAIDEAVEFTELCRVRFRDEVLSIPDLDTVEKAAIEAVVNQKSLPRSDE